MPGHGPLATKANLEEFHDMLVTARDRVKKLYDEGKTEQEVLAADPLAELSKKWAAATGPRHRADLHAQRLQLVPQSQLK